MSIDKTPQKVYIIITERENKRNSIRQEPGKGGSYDSGRNQEDLQ